LLYLEFKIVFRRETTKQLFRLFLAKLKYLIPIFIVLKKKQDLSVRLIIFFISTFAPSTYLS